NVNLLIDQSDAQRATGKLFSVLSGAGVGNQIRLRPDSRVQPKHVTTAPAKSTQPATAATVPTTIPALQRFITGYGQLFDAVPPQKLLAAFPGQPSAVDLITCWGDGRINIRRASERSLSLALS